jgi:hypothetical protein
MILTRDVIQAVNPYRNKIDIRLTDALIKAGPRIDERFQGKPRLAGVVRRELADALYLAGEAAPAEAQAHQSLATLEGAFGAADADALETRAILGTILHKQDNYPEARSVYEAGIAALGDGGPKRLRLEFEVGLAGSQKIARSLPPWTLAKLIPEVEATVGAYRPLHTALVMRCVRMGWNTRAPRPGRSDPARRRAGGREWIKREGSC